MSQEYKLLIDGKWVESRNIKSIKSPYDGKEVGKVHFAEKEHIEEAINSAYSAFSKTRKLTSHERSLILEGISEQIKNRKEELAKSITLQSGKVIKHSLGEVDRAINTFKIASEEAKRIGGEVIPLDLSAQTKGRVGLLRRFPIGVIVGITPFNFPLNLVAHKVAPAIACGNTIILKPSSQVPITSILLGEIIKETDYPSGGFNVLPSGYEEADLLLTSDKVKKITFTGSPTVGWELKRKAHRKKITLELGGNAALVVEPDANLEYAVKRAVFGAFSFSGQICISIQRIFLHKKIYDAFMADFVSQTKKLKIGNPLDKDTDIGPMINLNAAKKTEEWIQEAIDNGAKIVWGGKRDGVMFEPTILENVKPEFKISWFEAFAPVVVIYSYEDFEDALEGVNYSIYGLQAGIFTTDLKKVFKAYDMLEVGGVIVNDVPTFRIDHMPYGGVKESGFGREGVKYAIEEMTELKLLAINLEV